MSNATAAGQVLAVSQIALTEAACDDVYATAGYEASVANIKRTTLQNRTTSSGTTAASTSWPP